MQYVQHTAFLELGACIFILYINFSRQCFLYFQMDFFGIKFLLSVLGFKFYELQISRFKVSSINIQNS